MSKVLWSGRFKDGTSDETLRFTSSLSIDQRLSGYDVLGSIAHTKMLTGQKIISSKDGEMIICALKDILRSIDNGELGISPDLEDIHSNIEFLLTERTKDAGSRLHTARSRNDQVVTDVRMAVRDQTLGAVQAIVALQKVLSDLGGEHLEDIMPGFTHVQHAQPITLGHHLLAHASKLGRDADRFMDSYKRLNICPLGSSALAGTTYDIDRFQTADLLGFTSPTINSIDAVSDRDFVAEFIFAAALCMVHLSSICEELVYWSSPEFGFVEISDAYSTGSSIMPQKKNPDVAELTRGRSATAIGDLVSILTLMKGLPLSYNRDLQEDKTYLFRIADTLIPCLAMTAAMIRTARFRTDIMLEATKDGFLNATDLADYLVVKGLPFRKAHEVVGKIVQYAIKENKHLDDLTLGELRSFSDMMDEDVFSVLPVEACVRRRCSMGGTSPEAVREQIRSMEGIISEEIKFFELENARLSRVWERLLDQT